MFSSDEEDDREGQKLLRMLMTSSTNPVSEKVRNVNDFETEMEAELDKRAMEVEARGGVVHQERSLSRSSSTSSLNRQSPSPCPSPKPGSSKRVRFSDSSASATSAKLVKYSSVQGISSREPPRALKDKPEEQKKQYDGIYFDSDESEGEDELEKEIRKNKRNMKTDEDLFYDPESDARDQEWVDEHRRKDYNQSNETSFGSGSNPLPTSDAVLNCPACFTVLCLDCQRHEIYKSQYRAMFVTNCVISKDVTLNVPLKKEKKKYWKRKSKQAEAGSDDVNNPGHLPGGDSFNPVKCKVCKTEVAVYDTDEVYHFFNVLASHA